MTIGRTTTVLLMSMMVALLAGCAGTGEAPVGGGAVTAGVAVPSAFVGPWIAEEKHPLDSGFLPDFELFGDGTARLIADGVSFASEGDLATWDAAGGRLTLVVVDSSDGDRPPDIARFTYEYTLSDSTLTLSDARAVLVEDGQTKHKTGDGNATYKKGDPVVTAAKALKAAGIEAIASIESDKPAEADAPTAETRQEQKKIDAALTAAEALVGTWTAANAGDDFPPTFELLADGAATFFDEDGDDVVDEDEEVSVTWKVVEASLIISVIEYDDDGDVTFTATATFDYTLSGSTLTLSNGRVVMVSDGKSRNKTLEGEVTYTRKDE
ncbi:MAG: hypothetical protein FWE88_09475 [Phycisphaerae bacterium]|nr:hypothetical protein [Phycisphaerae bacterium]